MKLSEFISLIEANQTKLYDHPIIVFSGKTYPLLFFSTLITALNKNNPGFISIIDPVLQDTAVIKNQLQTSFLGMQRLFWFGSLNNLDANTQKMWHGFLHEYSGPNTIILFSDEPFKSRKNTIECILPAHVDKALFQSLVALAGVSMNSGVIEFTCALFDRVQSLSVENACLLAQYAGVVGSNHKDFFDTWLDKLVVSGASLFTLSQYFFGKDAKAFFAYWIIVGKNYSEPFWISFWSEQLYRAHAYVQYTKAGKRAEANRISYKLPFSFMQRDWRKHNVTALKEAHAMLYQIDYAFKNGGSVEFELFYSKFFEH